MLIANRYKILNLSLLLLVALTASACFDGWCIGGSETSGPSSRFYGIEVEPVKGAPPIDWQLLFSNDLYQEKSREVEESIYRREVLIAPDADKMIFDGKLVTFNSYNTQPIPDNLSSYKFTQTSGNDTYLVAGSDTGQVANTYRDTNRFSINYAATYLQFRNHLDSSGTTIVVDSAEFISSNRYKIYRYTTPVLNKSEDHIAYSKNIETHEVVVDSSGKVVDDFIYYREIELCYLNLNSADSKSTTLKTILVNSSEEQINSLDISNDGRYLAYELSNMIHLIDIENDQTSKIQSGSKPKFSPDSKELMFRVVQNEYHIDENNAMAIYDLVNKTVTNVGSDDGINLPVWSRSKNIIYYVDKDYIYQYKPTTGEHSPIFSIQAYHSQLKEEADKSIDSFYFKTGRPIATSNSLYFIGLSGMSLVEEDDC